MNDDYVLDEQLLQRLPLPLAQLCKRAQNAKTSLERHLTAYYLWESGLKLLATTAVVEYAELKDHDLQTTEKLKTLIRPSVGHWWDFVRHLVPVLAEKGDKGFAVVRELLLGRTRDDLPRAAGLYAALAEALDGRAGARTTVRLTELFDRLVTYRNREIGHGAAGQKKAEFYQRMGKSLLSGVCQVLTKLDVLAGRRLVYISDIRLLASGGWLIDRSLLLGDAIRRLEPLQLPKSEMVRLPRPDCVYLEGRRDARVSVPFPTLRPLHPLVHFDPETGKFFFLSTRRGKLQIEYLCYNTGDVLTRESVEEEQRELLAKIFGKPLAAGEVQTWATRSLADEPGPVAIPLHSETRSIGEFELLSRLGQGGMGIVYRAWQPSLGRQVALKCMLRSPDPKAETRFAREIRALGRVEHPNLVKVFTSGAEADQWFYAMELIEGTELGSVCEQLSGSIAADVDEGRWQDALSRACAEARSQETAICKTTANSAKVAPKPELPNGVLPSAPLSDTRTATLRTSRGPIRKLVEIVRQVAGAVHALHEAGVVHRDIKPGNIMMTADGAHPVLMDLGLAQLADETDARLTRTRQFVGTLRYASPEQVLAAGQVDRRTDIYSLGVTLWELLTLRPAFGADDNTPIPDLMLAIQTNDLENPRKHNRQIPRDLAAIVMKCVEKDRSRRYATANDVADDLGRFLNGEPVAAQPPSFGYLAGKFGRRYKIPLTTAAGIMLLTLAGFVFSFININAERCDAILAREREEKERERAVTAFNDLQKSRKEAETVWGVVEQAYSSVNEDNIRHLPGLSLVHEELASIRLEGILNLAHLTPADATIEPKVARAHAILGMVSMHVGSFQRAKAHLEKAAELYGQLAEKSSNSKEYRVQQCRALIDLGYLNWDDDRKTAARLRFDQALKLLEQENARAPQDLTVTHELALCLGRLGGSLPNDATNDTREKLALRTIRLFEILIDQKHREADSRAGLAVATYRLAYSQFDGKDQHKLLKSLDKVFTLERAAHKLMPQSPYINSLSVFIHQERATIFSRLGKFPEALAEQDLAVNTARQIVNTLPLSARYGSILAQQLNRRANHHRRLGRATDSRADFEESHRVMDGLLKAFPDRANVASQWVLNRSELADFLQYGPYENGELRARQEWLQVLDQTVQRGRELAARFPDHYWLQSNFTHSLGKRGQYLADAKRHDKALPYFLEAVEVYRTRVLTSSEAPETEIVTTYLNILRDAADCAHYLKQGDETIRLSNLALQVTQNCKTRAAVADWTSILATAAKWHGQAGRHKVSIQNHNQILEMAVPMLGKEPWNRWLRSRVQASYGDLADGYRKLKDHRNEVLSLRNRLRVWFDQYSTIDVNTFLAPGRPEDAAEADMIRAEIEKAGSMKRFTVPCDFNGIKYPFHVYVVNMRWPKHPLEDQARWLREERGGIVPVAVMDSFGKLLNIAHENNVSFVDLCVYALGTAAAEEGKQLTIEMVGLPSTVEIIPGIPGRAASDTLAPQKTLVAELQSKLGNSPNDLKLVAQTAELCEDLGQRLIAENQFRGAADVLRDSVRLREKLVHEQPNDGKLRWELAAANLSLGKVCVQLKEFDQAFGCFHRRLDLVEQLLIEAPTPELRATVAESYLLFGELAQVRDELADAVRWYVRAARSRSTPAGKRLAYILKNSPEKVGPLLPPELQNAFTRMGKAGITTSHIDFVANFAAAVTAAYKLGSD